MPNERPNILYIMSDDHASHAMTCYGSRINQTPNLDRIANEGMRFDNCFCTNSICTPSRAAILTGTYNHVNQVTTLSTHMDNTLPTFVKDLQASGYQTGMFGKWHLGQGPAHEPTGFDDWAVLPGQGLYHNPTFVFKTEDGSERRPVHGYVTDLITDMTLDFLQARDREQPFFVMCHHKAPHRHWEPDDKHADMFLNEDVPEPETLYDDYSNRASAAEAAEMRMGVHMVPLDTKTEIPRDLPEMELRKWAYQRYIKDYLRVVASIDDNVGRLLDYLDAEGLTENTIVIYTSDQGFFLGDHGWYDKRFHVRGIAENALYHALPADDRSGQRQRGYDSQCRFRADLSGAGGFAGAGSGTGTQFRADVKGRNAERLAPVHVLSILDAQNAS